MAGSLSKKEDGSSSSWTRCPPLPETLCFLRALPPSPPSSCISAAGPTPAGAQESAQTTQVWGSVPQDCPHFRHLHFCLAPSGSLERVTELRKTLYSGLQFSIEDTNEQPEGEVHRARSGRAQGRSPCPQEPLSPWSRGGHPPYMWMCSPPRSSLSLLVPEFFLKFHCAGVTD